MAYKTLITILTFNEGEKLARLLESFELTENQSLLVVDDGSSDATSELLKKSNIAYLRHHENLGVGAGIKTAVKYARQQNFEVIVIMAGNGKMDPKEINRLTAPIENDLADYVQGSRYLEGGQSQNLPPFRNLAIKLFTTIVNIVLGFKGTDITCGFRAYKLAILNHPDINIDQEWLGKYEMEYYIHYKTIKANFRVMEVPVSMNYPKEKKNYSKIKPFVGWWSMIRPWVFLVLKLKK